MIKNNKGIALAYTIMMMLLVFTICAVITSIAVSQATYSRLYSSSNETERIYTQIGEIFYNTCDEDLLDVTIGLEPDFLPHQDSKFAMALKDASFSISRISTYGPWTVTFESHEFSLRAWAETVIIHEGDHITKQKDIYLDIRDASNTTLYLTVGVRIITDFNAGETTKEIIQWTKGA